MGPQLDMVVDIRRGDRVGAIAARMTVGGGGGGGEAHSPRVSSSGTADSSDGKADAGDVVNHERYEHAVEKRVPQHVAMNGNASKNLEGSSKSSNVQDVESSAKDAASYCPSFSMGGNFMISGNFVIANGSSHDGERLMMKTGGSRKRKKTVYYMNSRVPHAVPGMGNDEGSDDQDSPEEADDGTVVRPSQAPRVAASKVRSQLQGIAVSL